MLRNFFEGLGDLFQATFKILPLAGDYVNRLFMYIKKCLKITASERIKYCKVSAGEKK